MMANDGKTWKVPKNMVIVFSKVINLMDTIEILYIFFIIYKNPS
jgi:hypothetical protein